MVGTVGRLVKVGHVATLAGCSRAFVDIVDVASGALHSGVETGQRELRRRIVVELHTLPLNRVMAERAVSRKASRHVVGIVGGLIEVGSVASVARQRRTGVLAVHVTGGTLYPDVRARERELGFVVIERPAFPCGSGVADIAVLGEPGGHMVRVLGAVVVLEVAALARLDQPGELTADVAGVARQIHVGPGQRELGRGTVIELRALPLGGVVALGAVLLESGAQVVRSGGLVEVGHVAAFAG